MRKSFVVLLMVLLAACATPYQEFGLGGGVSTKRIDASTIEVEGTGNVITSSQTIREFVLLRAAEETLRAGYGHFEILEGKSFIIRQTGGVGAGDFPRSVIKIRMHAGSKPAGAPGFDAREVVTVLGAKHRK